MSDMAAFHFDETFGDADHPANTQKCTLVVLDFVVFTQDSPVCLNFKNKEV